MARPPALVVLFGWSLVLVANMIAPTTAITGSGKTHICSVVKRIVLK